MEIHKKSSTRLFAQLSQQELSRYRLTFETLCPDGERTKTVLCDILAHAENTIGWTVPPQSRVFVDVLPAENGSCIFLFTATVKPKKRYRVRRDACMRVCTVNGTDAFLALYSVLCHPLLKTAEITLYQTEKQQYIGLFRFRTPFEAAAAEPFLSEFGSVCAADVCICRYYAEHAISLPLPTS